MMKACSALVVIFLVLLPVLSSQAAPAGSANLAACPQIVQQAWQSLNQLCHQTARNTACYGHVLLKAQPQPDVHDFAFATEGDIVDVAAVQSLQLSAMDLVNGYWGVALMRIQANLPATAPDKNVALLLFGDVRIAAPEAVTAAVPVINPAARTLNVRSQPSASARIVGTLGPGETAIASGQLANGLWVRVTVETTGQPGWIYAPLIVPATEGVSLADLPVMQAASQPFGPMQAFYLQSGVDDAPCPEAPNSGLLVQTPEGVAEVTLLINAVEIRLGSTVYLQAQPGAEATISVLEGHARVRAQGTSYLAPAGSQIVVPLGEDLTPAGPPSPPRPYDLADFAGLPLAYLDRPIALAPPLTLATLEAAVAQAEAELAAEQAAMAAEPIAAAGEPATVTTTGDLPPGLVDNPGLGDDLPPGHGGEPPGKTKKDKKD